MTGLVRTAEPALKHQLPNSQLNTASVPQLALVAASATVDRNANQRRVRPRSLAPAGLSGSSGTGTHR